MQIVSFCNIFLNYTDSKSILCIVPVSTIDHWVREFNKWSEIIPTNINALKDIERTKAILTWIDRGGVLILGYELFKSIIVEKKRKPSENLTIRDALLTSDLVICDEGHRIKNMETETSEALKKIVTPLRIILRGYPLQNNVMEYWTMIDFVRPNYLGSKDTFTETFYKPIQNGSCTNASPESIKLMRYRSYVLYQLLSSIVQRRSNVVLKGLLPPITDYSILLKMTSLQKELYRSFINKYRRKEESIKVISGFAIVSKIFSHPDILVDHLHEPKYDWSVELMKGYVPHLIENSPKMEVFFKILAESVKIADRLLVFSQSIVTLDIIETFLHESSTNKTKWIKNWNYCSKFEVLLSTN